MSKILKLSVAVLVATSLGVATVLCCCTAASVLTHFQKSPACGHCSQEQNSSNPSSNPTAVCPNQLSNAELLQAPAISVKTTAKFFFPTSFFLDKSRRIVVPRPSTIYPPGGPPPRSFTPLYLRTFNLRI